MLLKATKFKEKSHKKKRIETILFTHDSKKKRFMIKKEIAATPAVIGRVMTQVISIRWAVSHLTPFRRCAEPTPKIPEEITCVVLTGK